MTLGADDLLARKVTGAIRSGDVEGLRGLLEAHGGLADCRIVTPEGDPGAGVRSLLHVATDWPGHFPGVAETIRTLLDAGATATGFVGAHAETPLHWAASSNDVAALDALLDGGADIEAPGAVIRGGSALEDAVAFGQWEAARRLVERGARITQLWQAAGLGRMDLAGALAEGAAGQELTAAFWCACWGGQREAGEFLLARGAEINWVGWDGKTPLDAAATGAGPELVAWLRERGAVSAGEVRAARGG